MMLKSNELVAVFPSLERMEVVMEEGQARVGLRQGRLLRWRDWPVRKVSVIQ